MLTGVRLSNKSETDTEISRDTVWSYIHQNLFTIITAKYWLSFVNKEMVHRHGNRYIGIDIFGIKYALLL